MKDDKKRKAYLENQAKLRQTRLCDCGKPATDGDKCDECKAQPEPSKEDAPWELNGWVASTSLLSA